MTGPRLTRSVVWTAAVTGLVLAAAAQDHTDRPSTPEPIKVMFPADGSVLESGKFDVVCAMRAVDGKLPPRPQLRVDGAPKSWERYQGPALLSRLQLTPGRHEITIGPKTFRIHVRDEKEPTEAPDGWPVLRTHQGATQGWKKCTTCHEVTKERGRTVVGALMEPVACQQCHSSAGFELIHFHPEEPLESCHTCHALHGSSRQSLLKAPVKTLCAECHD